MKPYKRVIVVSLLIFFVSFVIGASYVTQSWSRAPIQPPILGKQAPSTSPVRFIFSSNAPSIKPNGTVTVNVFAKTEVLLNGVHVALQWNPKMFTFVDMKPGTFFANPMMFGKHIDTKNGNLVFAFGSLTPSKNTSPVMTVTFKAKTLLGSTSVELLTKSKVAPQGDQPDIQLILPPPLTLTIIK